MAHRPTDGAVFNTMSGTVTDNIILSGGKLQLSDGSVDLLSKALKIVDGSAVTKTAYSAGVAQVEEVDFATATLAANSQYRVAVEFADLRDVDFNNVQVNEDGGRAEANELVRVREYIVWTGSATPTADSLRDAFIARINGDTAARVTAASGGAGILELTMDDVNDGEFIVTVSQGATVSNAAPYTAPSGTPAIVEADFPGQSSAAGEYTTWTIDFTNFRRSNVVSGAVVGYPEYMTVYANEQDGNFAIFETELDAVLDGTHTPASDYLGI